MLPQKMYSVEGPRISDHISRDSGAGDAPMVSKKFNRCPGEYQFTEIKSAIRTTEVL